MTATRRGCRRDSRGERATAPAGSCQRWTTRPCGYPPSTGIGGADVVGSPMNRLLQQPACAAMPPPDADHRPCGFPPTRGDPLLRFPAIDGHRRCRRHRRARRCRRGRVADESAPTNALGVLRCPALRFSGRCLGIGRAHVVGSPMNRLLQQPVWRRDAHARWRTTVLAASRRRGTTRPAGFRQRRTRSCRSGHDRDPTPLPPRLHPAHAPRLRTRAAPSHQPHLRGSDHRNNPRAGTRAQPPRSSSSYHRA